MSDNQNNGGMFMGFIVGSALGAGLALLLAPGSGDETRRRLGQTANDLGNNARSMINDVTQEIRDGAQEVKSKVDEGKNRLAQGVSEVKKDARDASWASQDGKLS